jgi:hypothetical protein
VPAGTRGLESADALPRWGAIGWPGDGRDFLEVWGEGSRLLRRQMLMSIGLGPSPQPSCTAARCPTSHFYFQIEDEFVEADRGIAIPRLCGGRLRLAAVGGFYG